MSAERLICTFSVADRAFGLDVRVVQEVLRHQPITRVPLAAPAVRGIINLRGRIVPAIDLRRCLAFPEGSPGLDPSTIVVQGPASIASLVVDEIGDVVPVPESSFEPPPDTVSGAVRSMALGVFPLQDRLLLELDLAKILRAAYA
ncbi:MAG: chemotaxis protein CheW [Hyphomicrobiales bacterium]